MRGALGEAEKRDQFCMLVCAQAGNTIWCQEQSSSGPPACPVAVGPDGPAPIVLNVILWNDPFEKAGNEYGLDQLFMHIWYTRPTVHS